MNATDAASFSLMPSVLIPLRADVQLGSAARLVCHQGLLWLVRVSAAVFLWGDVDAHIRHYICTPGDFWAPLLFLGSPWGPGVECVFCGVMLVSLLWSVEHRGEAQSVTPPRSPWSTGQGRRYQSGSEIYRTEVPGRNQRLAEWLRGGHDVWTADSWDQCGADSALLRHAINRRRPPHLSGAQTRV